MLSLPSSFASVILAFASLFRYSVWCTAQLLLVGTILAPGKRTLTAFFVSWVSRAITVLRIIIVFRRR